MRTLFENFLGTRFLDSAHYHFRFCLTWGRSARLWPPPIRGMSKWTIFGPPNPPHINFVHDEIGKLVFIYYYLGLGLVIRHFIGRALRPWVRLVKTVSRPRATARTGLGAERCGLMVNYIHVQQFIRSIYKIDRGGVQKSFSRNIPHYANVHWA